MKKTIIDPKLVNRTQKFIDLRGLFPSSKNCLVNKKNALSLVAVLLANILFWVGFQFLLRHNQVVALILMILSFFVNLNLSLKHPTLHYLKNLHKKLDLNQYVENLKSANPAILLVSNYKGKPLPLQPRQRCGSLSRPASSYVPTASIHNSCAHCAARAQRCRQTKPFKMTTAEASPTLRCSRFSKVNLDTQLPLNALLIIKPRHLSLESL